MSGKRLHIFFGLIAVMFMTSCGINRYVPDGKYLVQSNKVVIEENGTEINKKGLSSYISLKPYKSTFQTDFGTRLFYLAQRHPNSRIWKWMNKNFGRTPVYYDPSEANNSASQMMRYLDNVGYFHSKVTHTVTTKGKKAKVTYHVYPTKPYRMNSMEYVIPDSIIRRTIMRDSARFALRKGDIYNSFLLNDERELITERMRNSGYYYFNRDNIYYEVDSNFLNHTMSVTMRLKDNRLSFKKYHIREVSVYPDYSVFKRNNIPVDTASLYFEIGRRKRPNLIDFYYYDKPQVKPQTFSQSINIIEGLPYNERAVTSTYKALSNFRLFRNASIDFDSVANTNDSINYLDCRITMQQNDVHSFTVQAEGTNSDGDLGIKGSFAYTNKNFFHGAETFQLSLKGGLEAQTLIGDNITESGQKVFNTSELGITASLNFPKFLSPISFLQFARDYQPTTSLTLGLNGQVRYYYSRYTITASLSYDWKSDYRKGHNFSPIYLNSVKIANINPVFQDYIDNETSQRKKDQYTSHLVLGTRYSFVYSSQRFNQTGSFIYLRTDLESSGNLLSLFNKTKILTENDGHHELFGIRYSQYVRGCIDVRQHLQLGEQFWFVTRQFAGLGLPYGNSRDLPFERSFYGGGANGLRGWLYRTVGPGGYVAADNDIERTGDMQLELNAELRFPIYNIFNGAVFVDAGNVWTYNPNESMPNAEFGFDTFYKQIALDAGIGVRLDVSFLIIRLDIAYAMRNPYPNENGSYWRFGSDNNIRMQMGIGYPF